MKVIYMEQTLNLIASQNIEVAKSIISTGIVKQSEFGTYLVIETKSEEQI
jgi:hypothetical protein